MKIIEERPNMITVPVHDCKSEDELKFIASLGTFDQQQKLFVTSPCENIAPADTFGAFACKICSFTCENHLALASHQINHQLNRHFCCYGCGVWCNTLEEILEHEFRKHAGGLNGSSCRICELNCSDAASLAKHMSSHFYVRRFVCAVCRRHFETRQGLQLHRQHSKEVCGQVEYADIHGNVGQLVAVSKLDAKLPEELACDVEIKTEPLEAEEQQPETEHEQEMADIVIKTEPEFEADELSFGQDANWMNNSLAGQLRGKLRLPAIQKPIKVETVTSAETPTAAPPTIQFVPAGKWKPIPIPNTNASVKLPNILKPKKGNNQQKNILKKNVLQSLKNKPNIAANILKVLPSNCMLIKLPPNTKIVKIAPSPTSVNTNSCTIGSKIITLPSAMSISSVSVGSKNHSVATVPSPTAPSTPQAEGTQKAAINRNAYFNALSLFESLPESRKIITEFQNQIRSIEQTLPLPGSVLQTPKRNNNLVLPSQLEVLRLAPTKSSNVKVRQLRYTYPNHRFHWECPKCARCYEQYLPFCNHMTQVHGIAEAEFEHIKVEVKTYKKLNLSKMSPATSPIEMTPAAPTTAAEAPVIPGAAEPTAASTERAPEASTVTGPDSVVESAEVAPVEAVSLSSAKPTPVAPVAPAALASTPPASAPAKSTRPAPIVRPAQYQCEDCSKCFTTVGALRIHKMIHTGELPHKCNYCDKRFRTPGQVRVHQRRHTGEKPFKCKVCSLDFTHRETLISHLSRHIGMKRYKCYGCDKNFVVVSGLRAHRRLRPDTCGKVKFTARAHGPRVRVIRGEVVFESHPEHNGYLRSEDPLNIMSEINQASKESSVASESS
ncbi:sal-like protein 1 [Drosophila novamexicana]|uniref:sal-like protein 1 n=1 Tax=Drosophila novamexicana TaxID=47314 RepID=UPI0011E5BBE4|nr:sal-like protein 1 [Drosophila novamexicana]